MKKTAFHLVMVIAAMTSNTLSGQNKKQETPVTERRQIDGFHSLIVSGLADVYLQEGPAREVMLVVSGMPNDDVVVLTTDSVLNIYTKGSHNGESVKVYVNYVTLRSIGVSGAAKLYGETTVKNDNLTISITNSGDATLNVDVNNLTLILKQAGDLKITGKVNTREIRSVGDDGTLDDKGLKVAKVESRD
jgi:hypothetical protein